MLLTLENISKNYGLKQLLDNVNLNLDQGQKLGIIGNNGTGKSTLLKILAGEETADEGKRQVFGSTHIAYLPQNPPMTDENSVLEQVFAFSDENLRDLKEYEAKTILTKLGITDFDQKVGTLSGGQRKRLALAATLIRDAEVLILDEPTNHLDAQMVLYLEERLIAFRGSIIMVTHDRYFLERVANKIVELTQGKLYFYEANYSKYLEEKLLREDIERANERKRQTTLRREYAWISRGARARSTKSTERIARYEALKEQEAPTVESRVALATSSTRMGKKVISLENVSKSFDDKCVLKDFSYSLLREDRIGIVGRNGAGKSTLLNLISGVYESDTGIIDMGSTIKIGYFTQEGIELPLKEKVINFINEIGDELETSEGKISSTKMLDRFLFTGDMQYSPIEKLSGGEKRRLQLLAILMSAPNVLLLDEPTNDLDIHTLAILEDYIEDFQGAVLAVSHDRYFLDRIAHTIFEVGETGEITRYNGGYSDYLEQKPAEIVVTQEKPKAQDKPRQGGNKKLKFSFNEQREFDTIDDVIETLENKIKALSDDERKFSNDYVKLLEISAEKEKLEEELEEKTLRWVYLNELAEKIEAQG